MTTRFHFLPDPAFQELKPILTERLARVGGSLQVDQFAALLDPLMRQTLQQGFDEAGADEGTLWLLEPTGQFLVPAFNTGPRAGEIVGQFKQPLNTGLVCMVFANEQPFLENEIWKNEQQSKMLDALLAVQTCAMIAVPFDFLQSCRGVLSCVQLKKPRSSEPDPPGFRPEHLISIQRTASLVSQLIEYRLLSQAVGWPSE